jgi:hypothetical protein
MRAAPAFQVSLRPSGLWRAAVILLAAAAAVAIVVWLSTRESPAAPWVWVLVAFGASVLAASAASLACLPGGELRWDGRTWHLGRSTGEPLPGDLTVAIDLGTWMLLRFVPAGGAARSHGRWLPVQRRGLESQWHALRCAVYSPRPIPQHEPPIGF